MGKYVQSCMYEEDTNTITKGFKVSLANFSKILISIDKIYSTIIYCNNFTRRKL